MRNTQNYHRSSSRFFSKKYRFAIASVVITIILSLCVFSTGAGGIMIQDGQLVAAQPTAAVKASGASPDLPVNKAQAQAFEKQYPATFNFDKVNRLNKAYSNGADLTTLINSDGNVVKEAAAVSTPAPTPTLTNLRVMAACPSATDVYEANNDNSSATTNQLQIAVIQTHTLESLADEDWARFTTQSGRSYTLTASSNPVETYPAIYLLDDNADINNPIAAENGNATSGSDYTSSITFIAPSSGNYFIRVFNGNPNQTNPCGTYTLTLTLNNTTPIPTATTNLTTTPKTCNDEYEPDFTADRAKLLKVSQATTPSFGPTPGLPTVDTNNDGTQQHFACPAGDVDWVYFDLVKGKPYTVFTSQLKNGVDSFMVLYSVNSDGSLNPIYSSDDYPGAGLASRIDWIVPNSPDTALGEFVRYYLGVKDVSGHGGDNMSYNLTLAAQGNGLGNCFDLYEPDNGPASAKEIVISDLQVHIMCPDGDIDWIKFFAKAGRVYQIYTNFSSLPSAGLDTSLFVWAITFDPANRGRVVSQISLGQNDDRSDTDLASQVNFRVPADGVYYAEVKNAGAVGRNGMIYRIGFVTGAGPASPTTTTAAATPTATTTASASSIQSLGLSFGDPSFRTIWEYNDLAVITGRVGRTWLWGTPGLIKSEQYSDAPGGNRQVQYFDKSRMEINNPKGNRDSRWFVSNGLLVREMILGKMATGDSLTSEIASAEVPVAGDMSDTNPSPTYRSFASLITVNGNGKVSDRTGKNITGGLRADGTAYELTNLPASIKLAKYVPETGHNIPEVFWNYLNSNGTVFDGKNYVQSQLMDWVYVMGLPLSEAYWTRAVVGGVEKDVMVQVFERRVLTYTPSNNTQWQVEMGNVGLHYYQWRYANQP